MTKVAILFPGGGSQYVGMGRSIYEEHKAVRELYEEANDILGYNLRKICFDGPLDKLSQMRYSQPAIFTVSIAAYRFLQDVAEITPAFVCGHSLGEYAALTVSGGFRFCDALEVLKIRGALLQKAGSEYDATMIAVNKVGTAVIMEECKRINDMGGAVYIAVYNSEMQHVVSGKRSDIQELEKRLAGTAAEVSNLLIDTPSHCPLMQPAATVFLRELERFTCGMPGLPVISNVTARPYAGADDIFPMLAEHMVRPVRWLDTVRYLEQQQVSHFIEAGPQSILKNLMPFISKEMKAYAVDRQEDMDELQKLLLTQ